MTAQFWRQILLAAGALLFCLLWFDLTPTDLWLQQLLFDADRQQWIWSRTEPFTHFLLYTGIKEALIIFGIALLFSLIFFRNVPIVRNNISGVRIVLLSLILVPACVGALKNTTNVACPRDLAQFGGELHYSGILSHLPADIGLSKKQRCFPAGHASGGFALLSLVFLFKLAHHRRRALMLAIAAGWTMGAYKMLIGDHFLSHTITTMLLAWLIVHLVALVNYRFLAGPPARAEMSGAIAINQ